MTTTKDKKPVRVMRAEVIEEALAKEEKEASGRLLGVLRDQIERVEWDTDLARSAHDDGYWKGKQTGNSRTASDILDHVSDLLGGAIGSREAAADSHSWHFHDGRATALRDLADYIKRTFGVGK